MRFRYSIFLIVSLLLISFDFSGQAALAQATNEITGYKNVTLWVYPEYDNPRLLVMMEGKINGATLPAQVRFLVPTSAELFSAGSKNASGAYSGGPPNRKASQIAGWDEISYTLPTSAATFRVEYYNDIITGDPDKQISFDFRWLYPISDLAVVIQQPTKASNFVVSPAGIKTSEEGFTVSTYNKTNLAVPGDQPLHYDISYTKSDPNPSLGNAATASGSSSGSSSVALFFIAAALIVVAIFLIIFFLKRNSSRRPAYAGRGGRQSGNKAHSDAHKEGRHAHIARSSGPATSVKSAGPQQESNDDKFCNQCGEAIGKSAKFCPSCGSKLGNG